MYVTAPQCQCFKNKKEIDEYIDKANKRWSTAIFVDRETVITTHIRNDYKIYVYNFSEIQYRYKYSVLVVNDYIVKKFKNHTNDKKIEYYFESIVLFYEFLKNNNKIIV